MYISSFWIGYISGLGSAIVAFIVAAIILNVKEKHKPEHNSKGKAEPNKNTNSERSDNNGKQKT